MLLDIFESLKVEFKTLESLSSERFSTFINMNVDST